MKLFQTKKYLSPNSSSYIFLTIFVVLLFLFLRFYQIPNSLFFFNDMGRDAYALQAWQETGKPPLLGPQTSALAFNQSALYFYLLYPLFLLTKASPLSPLFTSALIYLSSFFFSLYLAKNQAKLKKAIILVFFLFTIHPQHIIQNRYIWNPSLVPPFMLVAFTSLNLLLLKTKEKINQKLYLWIFSLSLATAISLSYSVLPVALAIFIYLFLKQRSTFFRLLFPFPSSLFLLNLPTVFFELRHKFILTSTVISRSVSSQGTISILEKFQNLITHSFNLPNILISLLFLLLLLSKTKKPYPAIIFLSLLAFLLFPVNPQAHYIFGLSTLIFFATTSFQPLLKTLVFSVLIISYLSPTRLSSYFAPAPRTYQQMLSCYQKFCSTATDPIFVSVNSSYHPYHHGPEHRYLLKKAGCKVIDQETSPNATNLMAVIADGGQYEHQKTQFFELEVFGNSNQLSKTACQDNLNIYLLQR